MSVHSNVLSPRRGGKTAVTPAPKVGSGFGPSFTKESVKHPKVANSQMQPGVQRNMVMNDNDGDELPNAVPEVGLAVQKQRGPGFPSSSISVKRGKPSNAPKAGKVKRNPLLGIYGGRA